MSLTTPSPQYIYKILPATPAPSTPLPLALPVSPLDRSSGYIHASTAAQLLNTLTRFFSPPGYEAEHVYLLRIPYAQVQHAVKWENGEGVAIEDAGKQEGQQEGRGAGVEEGRQVDVDQFFPHIYETDLKLGREEVEQVAVWKRSARDGWSSAQWPFGHVDCPP